ncbi:unnamed protein product [Brugia pahangi]|uniref:Uncharacterized protein n=1 Tax=Brugia pahangi TaxID=6280 RepID=A0A0N4T3K8_BRUPA|nr:unnamed protein product [Brugia pahangi]
MNRDYGNPKTRLENSKLEDRHVFYKRFWIPKRRAEVKTVFNKCIESKRWKTRSFKLRTVTILKFR